MKKSDKPRLVYFNPDCYTQVDDTVLHHLTAVYDVIWFYLYESLKSDNMRYDPQKASSYASRHGITLEVVDPKMRRRNPGNLSFFRAIADKINSYDPDIVYSCDIIPFWALTYRHIECKNKVFGVHDVKIHSYKFNLSKYFIHFVKTRLIKRIPYLFTFSKGQHDLLKDLYGKESAMVGMSCKSFGESHIIPLPIDRQVRLLFFGGISRYKGLDLLISSLEQLRNEGITNLFLTIAGQGESWPDCAPLIKTKEMYDLNIRFIRNDEIPDLMNSCHFLVLPYRNASQSGPLVTALGYGLPVIAPDYGCFTEMYDRNTAVLYPDGGLKQALKEVSAITPEAYDKMKAAVRTLRELYSEENVAKAYIKAFSDILQHHENSAL